MDKKIEFVQSEVKRTLQHAECGHDFSHAVRVMKNAEQIAASEGGDLTIIQAASLLHDVSDEKFSNDENIRSRVERLSKEITLANQIGDEEKSLKLACLVLDIFSEEGIIDLLKYGNVDARGNITHIRDFPNEFPIIETTDDQGIYSYEVDEGEIKSMLSNNKQYEYIVILSPWDGYPLFKIKISDDFIFWLTGE